MAAPTCEVVGELLSGGHQNRVSVIHRPAGEIRVVALACEPDAGQTRVGGCQLTKVLVTIEGWNFIKTLQFSGLLGL